VTNRTKRVTFEDFERKQRVRESLSHISSEFNCHKVYHNILKILFVKTRRISIDCTKLNPLSL